MSLPSIEALTIGYFLSACTEALTKKDMKPRRTPCSFSKRSWYFLRSSMTGCMLTSLNVVRIAAVDCDCTRRSAMRTRKRLIGTRCSGRFPRICSRLTGALGWGKEGFAATGASSAGGLVAPSTSPFVTRPPRPLPAIEPVSMPFSSESFRAEGMAGAADATGAGFAAGAAGFTGTAAEAAAFPSVSIVAMTSPALTVPPSPLMILASTPSAGAGSSRTTLSVSMSIRFSSRLTASPTFLCHASKVASATDSESCGTLISMSMLFLLDFLASRRPAGALDRANQIVRHRPERRVDQLLLLLVVQGSITHRGRGRGRPRGIGEDLVLAHVPQEVALDPVPRPLVRRFLLAPEDLSGVAVKVDLLLELVLRKGIELGDAHDGRVLDRARLASLAQIEEHLAAAENHAFDVLRLDVRVPLGVDRLELALGEFLQRRNRFLVAKQALGAEDDERLAVGPDHLAAQEKKHLHRGRGNAHLDVVVGTELQVSLRAPGRMLGPLPFVAVRQHHHQAADAAPLDLPRSDELVDHHLSAVGEVAELRLPHHQLVGLRGRIAVLEAEHGLLGEHRVDDDEIALVGRDIAQRDVAARVPLFAVLVVQHRVTMEKGAAAAVLSGNAHRKTVLEQGRIGEVFRHSPVDRQLPLSHQTPVGDDLLDARVELEVRGDGGEPLGEHLQVRSEE